MVLFLHPVCTSGLSGLVELHLPVVQLNSDKAFRVRLFQANGFYLHGGSDRPPPPVLG